MYLSTRERARIYRERLCLDAEEAAAVDEAARRNAAVWETCAVDGNLLSPAHLPSAEAAIDALDRPLMRRVRLLDLALMEASVAVGRECGHQATREPGIDATPFMVERRTKRRAPAA